MEFPSETLKSEKNWETLQYHGLYVRAILFVSRKIIEIFKNIPPVKCLCFDQFGSLAVYLKKRTFRNSLTVFFVVNTSSRLFVCGNWNLDLSITKRFIIFKTFSLSKMYTQLVRKYVKETDFIIIFVCQKWIFTVILFVEKVGHFYHDFITISNCKSRNETKISFSNSRNLLSTQRVSEQLFIFKWGQLTKWLY